ncbi:GNAT family N-acetyltransferase [Brevibacillus laterosporus]|uniref:GNAT family N-acetyltransferase n=1 Tax=Brevibacillus laterosporus TaxID=1465 RepID=UPI0011B0ADD1|nr:GNAT family N-acetyltransferase [Brevibacillus laterosporus]MCR8935959.1 GNAT family N-acetyltransferase [Brevibacillus laterosporus]MCZ0838598.1 GNAT family N-acetyltransferase [Brevibacillus laterosporus]MCZ0843243.1 GNAT family N-acetyltransferase [Brevibacillus laterosporus]MED1910595.1 GNAT family N-acetyltransferase [Brevibacillus laterosporus]
MPFYECYGLTSLKKDLITEYCYGQIDELYVVPEYRRQKTGQAIAEKLSDWLHSQEASPIYISRSVAL